MSMIIFVFLHQYFRRHNDTLYAVEYIAVIKIEWNPDK